MQFRSASLLLPLLLLTPTLHAAPPDWQLVWSDEFNTPGRPDPAKWNFTTGFHANHEAQYYTGDRPENVRIENGMLIMEGRREDWPNPQFDPASKSYTKQKTIPYTSAMLTTKNKFSWTYGRFEARAKVPKGQGMWPAIWFLGADIDKTHWPTCGEIDLMEALGRDPLKVYGTLHYSENHKHAHTGSSTTATTPPADDFHLYAIEWFPDRIDFFYDQTMYHSIHLDDIATGPDNPFRKPEYLLVNLALGGDWGGLTVDDSKLPQQFQIDYIRIYQQKTTTTAPAKGNP
jgi:beta-glucanase (GH16 family)